MQFSLKKYITEKYLTEKLQSDTLVNDILNDKGGMFTYYKMSYSGTMYYKVKCCYKELKGIIENTFNSWNSTVKDNLYYKGDSIISDDDKRALHKKYMDLFNKYINYTSKLFIKPDPQLIPSIAFSDSAYGYFSPYKMDLFNLTDEHFEKYTLQDIKKDKQLKEKVLNDIKHKLCFWFNDEGKILTVSYGNVMKIFSIDNDNPLVTTENGKRWWLPGNGALSIDEINDAVKQDNLIVNTLTMPLNDGTELKFPTIARMSFSGDKRDLCGIDFVKKYLDLQEPLNVGRTKLQSLGTVTSKACKLNKFTGWGNSVNDYVIIYYPEDVHRDYDGKVVSTYKTVYNNHYKLPDNSDSIKGYNEYKQDKRFNLHKKIRHDDFVKSQERIYKWVKDLFGKYKPYANGDQNRFFKYGVKLSDYDYETLYGDDEYCNEVAQKNILRYKALIAKNRSMIGISNFNDDLKKILPQLQAYTKTGTVLSTEIKKVFRTDRDKFKNLMTLYGVYSKILQQSLSQYGQIQVSICTFKKEYMNNKEMNTNNSIVRRCKEDKERIQNQISNLTQICDEISSIETKINKTLNN